MLRSDEFARVVTHPPLKGGRSPSGSRDTDSNVVLALTGQTLFVKKHRGFQLLHDEESVRLPHVTFASRSQVDNLAHHYFLLYCRSL